MDERKRTQKAALNQGGERCAGRLSSSNFDTTWRCVDAKRFAGGHHRIAGGLRELIAVDETIRPSCRTATFRGALPCPPGRSAPLEALALHTRANCP
jgi:hypothetical protein